VSLFPAHPSNFLLFLPTCLFLAFPFSPPPPSLFSLSILRLPAFHSFPESLIPTTGARELSSVFPIPFSRRACYFPQFPLQLPAAFVGSSPPPAHATAPSLTPLVQASRPSNPGSEGDSPAVESRSARTSSCAHSSASFSFSSVRKKLHLLASIDGLLFQF
jgi:hypothetical protein